ncbi:hypothetical protein H6501_02715 [Candidatus Woesearchaeota archaeon]|nr:hypothetical protein [Nanoarchaeota archaeon]MCB9370483.1 hypothetical protein [Candidatus Woesearchaeota archaeon]USN43561.1 MAG: hypothetical protein H6500_04160 [Candidatus Woesearchaeota archaeon]
MRPLEERLSDSDDGTVQGLTEFYQARKQDRRTFFQKLFSSRRAPPAVPPSTPSPAPSPRSQLLAERIREVLADQQRQAWLGERKKEVVKFLKTATRFSFYAAVIGAEALYAYGKFPESLCYKCEDFASYSQAVDEGISVLNTKILDGIFYIKEKTENGDFSYSSRPFQVPTVSWRKTCVNNGSPSRKKQCFPFPNDQFLALYDQSNEEERDRLIEWQTHAQIFAPFNPNVDCERITSYISELEEIKAQDPNNSNVGENLYWIKSDSDANGVCYPLTPNKG